MPKAITRSVLGKTALSMAGVIERSMPPPMACKTLPKMRNVMSGANPQKAEEAVNMSKPVW
jgi:hypothetical protein